MKEKVVKEKAMQGRLIKTKDMTKIALFVALISISSYINIPLPFTTILITGQTIVVNLIGLLLSPTQVLITMVIYVLLGLVGLPVFSGGVGGPAKLFGPTGGYILGFVLAAVLISVLKGKGTKFIRNCIATVLVGIPVMYIMVGIYMRVVIGMDWNTALVVAVLPFIPLDIVKAIFASSIAIPVRKAINLNE